MNNDKFKLLIEFVFENAFRKGYKKGLKRGISIGSHQAYNKFVKHRYWKEELVEHGCRYLCSECGYVSMQSYGCIAFGDKYNYCPNCGAKMEEERTQDET